MKDTTRTRIKKVPFLSKKIKTDVKELFVALGKAGVMYAAGKIDSGNKELVGVVKAFKIKADASDLAYSLVSNALINASHDIIEENRNKLKTEFTEEEKLYDNDKYVEFLDAIPDILNEGYYLDAEMLRHPRSMTFVKDYQAILKEWLILFGIESIEAEHIINRFPAYFIFSLNGELSKNSGTYSDLLQTLETPVTAAAVKELEWANYFSYLEKQVEEPVFDESFSLKQIYTPLRAYYNKKEEGKEQDLRNKETQKIPIDLKKELNSWINIKDTKRAIKVLSGGPGSGKSSFAKIWAAELAENRDIKILFIPLHLLALQENLKVAVGEFITNRGFFTSNPLNDIHKEDSKLLIVFDGLDELSKQGKVGENIAKEFVNEIERTCRTFNNSNQINLLILISGRELIVQSVSSDFRHPKQIIHLLPYFIPEYKHDEFSINKAILKTDQRNDWWIKFGKLTNNDFSKGMPEYLNTKNLEEITAQPLLNYLVALSVIRGEIEFSADTNLNEIYYDLIKGVHERAYEDRKEHTSIKNLPLEYFIRVLEEIAISAWHGGDVRTTTVQRIEQHIKDNQLSAIFDVFQESAKSGITRLLTAFYFREAGVEQAGDKTFEFTHKSFGEYLAARRIVDLVKQICDLHSESEDLLSLNKRNERDLLEIWCRVTGQTEMNNYLYLFIQQEVELRELEDVKNWQKILCKLFSYNIHHGMPFEKVRKEIREEQRIIRNAEETLFVLLNICAVRTKVISIIQWQEKASFSQFLSRMQPARYGVNTLALKCLSYLDLSFQVVYVKDLYRCNFAFSYFKGTELIYSVLCHTNLSNAYLANANLSSADLSNAHLSNANLSNAHLSNANLSDARLSNARLSNADLSNANLSNADLSNADLSNADLSNARLSNADLSNADLSNADLSHADLSHVKSLYRAKNIIPSEKEKLKKSHPHLFKKST